MESITTEAAETKPAAPVIWPATVYMDGLTPVQLPEEREDPACHCPASWVKMFKLHRRQGKFPYMHGELTRTSNQSVVARAFRNYMNWALYLNGQPPMARDC
jgi:hypothetical protein